MLLFLAAAHAATWPFRAPVPAEPLGDGDPFALCLELGVDLGFQPGDHAAGPVAYRCESEAEASRVCYQVQGTEWPDRWEPLVCEGTDTKVVVTLVEAFQPRADLSKGVVIKRGLDKAAAVFEVGSAYRGQRVQGHRGTVCEVASGRLFVSRRGPSRRRDVCELRDASGATVPMPIRFKGRLPRVD